MLRLKQLSILFYLNQMCLLEQSVRIRLNEENKFKLNQVKTERLKLASDKVMCDFCLFKNEMRWEGFMARKVETEEKKPVSL